jgi:hypothetical protein
MPAVVTQILTVTVTGFNSFSECFERWTLNSIHTLVTGFVPPCMPLFSGSANTDFSNSNLNDVGGNQTLTGNIGGVHIQVPNYSASKC